jgi:hypothetical protein
MVLFAAKFDPQQQAVRSSAFLVSRENLRDALLTEYINQMKHLIIDWDPQKRRPDLDISVVARTLTLTALSRLNENSHLNAPGSEKEKGMVAVPRLSSRKRLMLQFLYEAK